MQKIIFPSSFAVYDPHWKLISEQTPLNPGNFYGHLKKWAEELLLKEQANLDIVIFRQSNVMVREWFRREPWLKVFANP